MASWSCPCVLQPPGHFMTLLPLSAMSLLSFYSAKSLLGLFFSSSWVSYPRSHCPVFPKSSFFSSRLSFSTAHSINLINYLLIIYDARIEYHREKKKNLCFQQLRDCKGGGEDDQMMVRRPQRVRWQDASQNTAQETIFVSQGIGS